MQGAPHISLALDVHLPFSYWRTCDFDHGDPVMRPRPGVVEAYARALMAEIASLGADVKGRGYEVGSVFFSGGYVGLLDPEAFRDILRMVRRSFDVSADLRVDAVTFPGMMDMYAASAYLDEGVKGLLFEVPTLSAREAAALAVPNTLQALDKSVYVLQSYGAAEFGLRMPVDVSGRSVETWEYLLGQVNHYHPAYVELVGLSACDGPEAPDGQGKAAGNLLSLNGGKAPQGKAIGDGGRTAFEMGLAKAGFKQVACDARGRALFSRLEEGPAPAPFGYASGPATERLGVGLGAETILDGFWTKSTVDMKGYLAGASDYRNLIAVAREVGEEKENS